MTDENHNAEQAEQAEHRSAALTLGAAVAAGAASGVANQAAKQAFDKLTGGDKKQDKK